MSIVRGIITVVLGLGLVCLVAMVGAWAVDLLPGVTSQLLEPDPVWAIAVVAFGAGAVMMGSGVTGSLRGGWGLVKSSAVVMVDVLGVWLSVRRVSQVVLLGLVGAVVIYGLVTVLVTTVDFPEPEGPDVRWVAVGDAPRWSAGLYFAVGPAPMEEFFFRGGLLALERVVSKVVKSQTWYRVAVVVLLVISSGLFGIIHLRYSVANVVTWGLAGLILGGLALACHSVWPAVLAHSGANFLIGWAQV